MRNKKKGNLDGCVHEVELYIKNITEKFGAFEYAPSKINYDPKKEEEQIKILYPKVKISFFFSSGSSINDAVALVGKVCKDFVTTVANP